MLGWREGERKEAKSYIWPNMVHQIEPMWALNRATRLLALAPVHRPARARSPSLSAEVSLFPLAFVDFISVVCFGIEFSYAPKLKSATHKCIRRPKKYQCHRRR